MFGDEYEEDDSYEDEEWYFKNINN
jgi:hypothetical protein